MTDRLILIGRISGAFGVKGEVRITAYGDDPQRLLAYGDLKKQNGEPVFSLLSGRVFKSELIATTKPMMSKEAIDAMRGLELYIDRDRLPPTDDDEFYLADLIGLRAQTPEGEALGIVKAVQNFGAGDLLEIQNKNAPAFYLPFTSESAPAVHIAEGFLVAIRPIEVE